MNVKTIVITGASDGIGLASARILKEMGHNVIIVGRNKAKTERAAKELNAPYHTADFANLSEVVALANELKKYGKIDVLANNAGGALNKREVTVNGYEKTFQVNVLGEFLLTNLLLDVLIESNATVIQTSSIASNIFGKKFDINDIQNEKDYDPIKAYGESKLCNYFFTKELCRRYAEKGLKPVAFEPGVVRSNFASESTWYFKVAYHTPLKYLFTISTKKSAKRLVRLAVGEPEKDFEVGGMYSYKKPYKVKYKDENGEISKTLWEKCYEMTKEFIEK